jgi:hypothetical protein
MKLVRRRWQSKLEGQSFSLPNPPFRCPFCGKNCLAPQKDCESKARSISATLVEGRIAPGQ